jgi:hypothetical protein
MTNTKMSPGASSEKREPHEPLTVQLPSTSLATVKFAKFNLGPGGCCQRLVGIAQQGRVIGLRAQTFIVPEPALGWLAEKVSGLQIVGG